MTCKECYYDFDGVCAYHFGDDSFDTYGKPINELLELFPNGCPCLRPEPAFLSEQADGLPPSK